ncbi:uncharacterized protein LOC144619236 [Crassostrea virginica]
MRVLRPAERSGTEDSTESLTKLLEHILKCNNFMFNGEHYMYLQINGTAMGTKMAPSYANIFMGRLERNLLLKAPFRPLSWLRFIDDIEMKWVECRDRLEEFISFANSFHQSIKFTVEISDSENIFLDTTSTLIGGKIEFNLHTKPTDSHLYLMPTSCHPPHTFKGVPKGLATRIRRICSSSALYQKESDLLKSHLCKRGYKANTVQTAIDEMAEHDRQDLLRYKQKDNISRVPLYIGETGDLPRRINNHRSTIKTKKINEPVGEHFNLEGHKWEDMTVVVIDHKPRCMDRYSEKKQGKVLDAQVEVIPS